RGRRAGPSPSGCAARWPRPARRSPSPWPTSRSSSSPSRPTPCGRRPTRTCSGTRSARSTAWPRTDTSPRAAAARTRGAASGRADGAPTETSLAEQPARRPDERAGRVAREERYRAKVAALGVEGQHPHGVVAVAPRDHGVVRAADLVAHHGHAGRPAVVGPDGPGQLPRHLAGAEVGHDLVPCGLLTEPLRELGEGLARAEVEAGRAGDARSQRLLARRGHADLE